MNTDADPRFLKERLEASKNVVTDCVFELVEFARSITTGEILIIMRGASDDVVTVCQVMDQTGAYDSLTTEILETYDRLAAHTRGRFEHGHGHTGPIYRRAGR